MSGVLIFAIITITLALIFYTVGVFWERKSRSLNKKHVIIFWLGLLFDTTGTLTMSRIAKAGVDSISSSSQMIHAITGALAIVLMLFHAGWATWVLYKNNEEKKAKFHKLSIFVWVVWLVPYIIGMIIGMRA